MTETTVAAAAAQRRAAVVIEPADSDEVTDGHQVALEEISEIAVTVTSADGSRERVYRVAIGEAGAPVCLSGAVSVGFSLLISGGGSVDELVSCAESRNVTALYALDDGTYVPYILGAPTFVNAAFRELYADGLPELTPLVARSEGPPSADPAPAGEFTESWPHCLRGDIASGFSLVLYEGGSVEEIASCAGSLDVSAVYALAGGGYASYILGAPEFVNRPFSELFAGGIPAATPLIVKSDGPSGAGAERGGDGS